MATPGASVGSGALITPGGAQGPTGAAGGAGSAGPPGSPGTPGTPAWTLSSSSFTVPAIGASAVMNCNDTTWATIGEYVWVQSSPTVSDALKITAKTSSTLTLLNPPTAGMQASSDANNLIVVGSDSLLYLPKSSVLNAVAPSTDAGNLLVDGSDSQLYLPASAITPTITSVRLRSLNTVGNPNFEVDQRNIFNTVNNPGSGVFPRDRWQIIKSGTMNFAVMSGTQNVFIPGTNFAISSKLTYLITNATYASPAAGDYLILQHTIEGPLWRELCSDNHSLSLLLGSDNSTTIKIGVSICDSPVTKSLTKLLTLPAWTSGPPNWAVFTFPNLPTWPSGNFSSNPGAAGYMIRICLVAGSTFTSPANDTWQTGNYPGALGQTNWFTAVNNTLYLGFIQHEPGNQCTQLIDKPFTQNLTECQRYFCKSYSYPNIANTVTSAGEVWFYNVSGTSFAQGYAPFPVEMAKTPTVTTYNSQAASGVNSAQSYPTGTVVTGVAASGGSCGDRGFSLINATLVAGQMYRFQYTADTAW